ncbi:MAG: hypothetical protein RSD23_07855, partial [Ruthenibacterium sp.]
MRFVLHAQQMYQSSFGKGGIESQIPIHNEKNAFDNLKTNFELGAVHPLVIDTEQKAICIQFNEQRIPDLPYNGKWFEGK